MRVLAVLAILVFSAGAYTLAPAALAASKTPPEWAAGLGMRDLEDELSLRIGAAERAGVLSREVTRELRLKLATLEQEEQDWRSSRTFTAARFNETESQLLAIAAQLPFVPAAHPMRATPTETWSDGAGPPLDLSRLKLTFEDNFKGLSIGPDSSQTRWFAPIHGDFGAAHFIAPGGSAPFTKARKGWFGGDVLEIKAIKTKDGWRSGLMQSVDSHGRGFSQALGYFEMRAQLPRGPATWPAFWLLTRDSLVDDTVTRGELDIMEQYGSEPDRLHMSLHLWPASARNAGGLEKHWYKSKKLDLPGLSDGFHDFGVLVTPSSLTYYYDHRAIAAFPTLPEFTQPLYMLADLAMHEKGLERAKSPSILKIEYIRAYQLPATQPEAKK